MPIPTRRVKHNVIVVGLSGAMEAQVPVDEESGKAAVEHFNAWVRKNKGNIYVHTGKGDVLLKSMSVKWEAPK